MSTDTFMARPHALGAWNAARRRLWAELAVAAAVLGMLAVALQYRGGAYRAELNNDDIAHYVSGLFVHDYLLHGVLHPPLAYLRQWAGHYPLVAIGHWGPFYYGVEAVWMLLFGTGRAAVMLLAATVTAVCAAILYRLVSVRFGRIAGAAVAVALVLSPLVQVGTYELMLDMPIALICLLAALAFGRYLATLRWAYSLLFALLATAALLIKGNGFCLAFVPAFAVAVSGAWGVLRRWSFWAPAAIVVAVAGPWYVLTYGQVAAGFRYAWGWDYTAVAVPAFAGALLAGVRPVLAVLGVLGFALACARRASLADGGVAAAMAALLAGVFVFQAVVPAALQDRYISPALPPLLYFAPALLRRFMPAPAPRRVLATGLILWLGVACVVPAALGVPAKPRGGAIAAAREVWSRRSGQNPAVLVVGDEIEEGAMIAELAMRDPARPSLFAVRGSRLLGQGGYNSQDYRPAYASAQEVMAAIDRYAIPLVLVCSAPGHNRWAHIDQIEQARALAPQRWTLVSSSGPEGKPWRLYVIGGNAAAVGDAAMLERLSAPRALGGG